MGIPRDAIGVRSDTGMDSDRKTVDGTKLEEAISGTARLRQKVGAKI
jgi:hypothetical protein